MPDEKIETYCPSSQTDWRKWLATNHQTSRSVWLIFYKVSSKKHNLTWSEAVDEALCFGWIDSVKKTLDEERFIQYFSKRRATGTWSRVNKTKIKKLIASGLMTEAGLECIKVAKQNGSWTILDDVEALRIPEDLEVAFSLHQGAKPYFSGLSKSVKKGILFWIVQAKRPQTRQKRINEVARLAGQQLTPKQFG